MKRLIVLLMVQFAPVAYSAEVQPCRFENPWMAPRSVNIEDAEEYKYLHQPFEVKIQTGAGQKTCMLRLEDGVSIVVPKRFNTKSENLGVDLSGRSWVKVNGSSYPIVSQYDLAVVKVPEKKIILVQKQNAEYQYQQSLLSGANEPVEKEVSRCGGWCKTAWAVGAIIAIGLIANSKKGNDQPGSTGGGPTNPAP